MPKSKLYISVSSDDDAPSLKGAITKEDPIPSTPTMPTGKTTSPGPNEDHTVNVAAGRLPEEVYTNMLPSWRAAIRRKCVAVVEWESEVIGKWQVRSPLFLFSFSFSSQPRLLCWQSHGMGRESRKKSSCRSFVGPSPVALVRCVFSAYVDAWHTHVLPCVPAHVLLLWA